MCGSLYRAATPGRGCNTGNAAVCLGFHCETKGTADVSIFSLISLAYKAVWSLKRARTLQDKPVLPRD